MGKIISIKKLSEMSFGWSKTVLAGGSFDILNVGHVKFLGRCKNLGNVLIVGVANDEDIEERKGSLRPIIPAKQRAEIVAALQPVDYVFISYLSAYNDKILKLIKPNILAIPLESGKVSKRKKRKKEIELRFPFIRVKLIDQTKEKVHSTAIIKKIVKKYSANSNEKCESEK